MGSFGYKDERIRELADRSCAAQTWSMLVRHAHAACILIALLLLSYGGSVIAGWRAQAQESGTIAGLSVQDRVSIVRDRRGIPHIRARTLHDMFFAQGFAEASDRLFEMDLTRRYAYGTLAEVFGEKALGFDESSRAVDVRHIAQREWNASDTPTRDALQAFSDGINAARAREPLPVEFRMLAYQPQAWTPQDSLAVSIVAMLELADSWRDVEARSAFWNLAGERCYDYEMPFSDERYDVTIDGHLLVPHPANTAPPSCPRTLASRVRDTPHWGSNAWAAGAAHTTTHRALLANDPHVDLTIPGIWYAIDLQGPGFHAAGAVVPGLPGITIGHNEHLAWGVTNAQVATTVLYRCGFVPRRDRVREVFRVRFGSAVTQTYYRTPSLFSVPDGNEDGVTFALWLPYAHSSSPLASSLAIDRANSIAAATRALAAYRGSPENFIMADTRGSISYRLAGEIPDDPAWGRYVHPGCAPRHLPRAIPFARLPSRAANRNAMLLSANNRMYGNQYTYRLSAAFEPPYRAYRIAQMLHARRRYSVRYFEAMQLDTYSPLDAEIAARAGALAQNASLTRWNGRFDPSSKRASLAHTVRDYFSSEGITPGMMLADLRASTPGDPVGVARELRGALWPAHYPVPTWGREGRVAVDHPLSPMWYGMLSGATLPGDGDEYTIHLQEPGFAQGFRAVWDVGNWDAGGIVLPSGESGEPGSPHYDDLASTWIKGSMVALPFSPQAVQQNAALRLDLVK